MQEMASQTNLWHQVHFKSIRDNVNTQRGKWGKNMIFLLKYTPLILPRVITGGNNERQAGKREPSK